MAGWGLPRAGFWIKGHVLTEARRAFPGLCPRALRALLTRLSGGASLWGVAPLLRPHAGFLSGLSECGGIPVPEQD